MKNIKFRAWSEDTHEMIQVARLDIKEETIHYENGIKSLNREHELGFWWKPYVLMQYTGLKDKNGVEIYEYSELDGTYEVVFKDLKYSLRHISNNDIIDLHDYRRGKNGEIEVTREYTKV